MSFAPERQRSTLVLPWTVRPGQDGRIPSSAHHPVVVVRREDGHLPYYQFAGLARHHGLRHAIFTRHGGVSRPPWDTLNVGRAVGDSPAAVEENHRRICASLEVRREDIATAYQVGGAHVGVVNGDHQGTVTPATDALVTATPGVALMLRFADCLPILLYDPIQRALGLVHAGWRGTIARVAQQAARAMVAAFNCRPEDLVAGIGPGIGPCCYQVGDEVAAAVRAAFPAGDSLLIRQPDGSHHLDLWAANAWQLREMGVGTVEVAGLCTACRTDEFFSHRGEGGRTGRFAAVALLLS